MSVAALLLWPVLPVALADCAPVRWPSADPHTLDLLTGSPLNCLLLDPPLWKDDFLAAAHDRRFTVLASVGTSGSADLAKMALSLDFDGLVVEGDRPQEEWAALRALAREFGKPLVVLPARAQLDLERPGEIVGTYQGIWPGIKPEQEGAVHARPTGAPWIDTNSGFLRFLRASVPAQTAVWIANRPPENQILGPERYVQAIADAAIAGARWVVSLDSLFAGSLLQGDARSLDAWKRINGALEFYQRNQALSALPDFSGLALVQDASSGALISGSIIDMIEAKHIPASIVPSPKLLATSMPQVKTVLNIDPAGLSQEQKDKLRAVARQGATVYSGPPAWKMALPTGNDITFPESQVQKLDDIWKEINGQIGRRNYAVRVFGAPSMLSNLKAAAGERRLVLHLVNYSNYPIESITVHVLGKYKGATLLTPQGTRRGEIYEVDDGTGIDLDKVADAAILIIEETGSPVQANR
jgi:hypothetical protein